MYSLRLQTPVATTMTMGFGSSSIRKSLFSSTSPNNHTQSCSISRIRLAGRQKSAISATENEKNQTETVEPEVMPKHIAVIMDGNRRYAKSRGLPAYEGYRAGGKAFEQIVTNCLKSGVKILTVFAFSTENWTRPKEEVEFAYSALKQSMMTIIERLAQAGVRLSFIGSRGKLPEPILKVMSDVEEMTQGNKRMHLVVAFNYGGRYDITEAAKKIASKVKDGVLKVEEINDAVLEQHLGTNVIDEFPNPDLMIRSSGELRVSNFMLWQLAYTEMFFTKKLFPEFDDTDFMEAITAFQHRKRRFGGQKN